MSDDRLAKLKRAFERDPDDQEAFFNYLRLLMQAEKVSKLQVRSCALLGDPTCMRIMAQEGGLIEEGMKLTGAKLFMACSHLSPTEWILIASECLSLLHDPEEVLKSWAVVIKDVCAGKITLQQARNGLKATAEHNGQTMHTYESIAWYGSCFLTLFVEEDEDAAWDIFQETLTVLAQGARPEEHAFGWDKMIEVSRRALLSHILP